MKKHTYLAVLIVSLVVGLTVGGLRAQHTDPDPDCPSSCSGKTYLATCDNFISCHQGAKRTRRARDGQVQGGREWKAAEVLWH